MKNGICKAIIEMGFIIFLFYANLLMGEFERSSAGQGKSLAWAIMDIFTLKNFLIALVASFVGYMFVELLRRKLR